MYRLIPLSASGHCFTVPSVWWNYSAAQLESCNQLQIWRGLLRPTSQTNASLKQTVTANAFTGRNISLSSGSSSIVCLLVGCKTSQQHACISQGGICRDNCTCCHTEIEFADKTISSSHSTLTPDQPDPALTLPRQAPGKVTTGVPIFKSLVFYLFFIFYFILFIYFYLFIYFFFFFLRSPAISLGFTTFGWDFCVCDRFLIQPLR